MVNAQVWVDKVIHSSTCDMFNMYKCLKRGRIDNIEKYMQERVAKVLVLSFSTTLHCAELSRNVRQQAYISRLW